MGKVIDIRELRIAKLHKELADLDEKIKAVTKMKETKENKDNLKKIIKRHKQVIEEIGKLETELFG